MKSQKMIIMAVAAVCLGFFIWCMKSPFWKTTQMSQSPTQTVVLTASPIPDIVVREGNVSSTNSSEYVFTGCSDTYPTYKYSVKIPDGWTVTKKMNAPYSSSTNYVAESPEGKWLQVGCSLDWGDDICDDARASWTKFKIAGKTIEACYGKIDGEWQMGVLNLPEDVETHSSVNFWAKGLDKNTLNEIFSSYKQIGN